MSKNKKIHQNSESTRIQEQGVEFRRNATDPLFRRSCVAATMARITTKPNKSGYRAQHPMYVFMNVQDANAA